MHGDASACAAQNLEQWQETHLQRGPFVPLTERWPSYGGTRSQTIIIAAAEASATFYCYRETQNEGSSDTWQVFAVPWPAASAPL